MTPEKTEALRALVAIPGPAGGCSGGTRVTVNTGFVCTQAQWLVYAGSMSVSNSSSHWQSSWHRAMVPGTRGGGQG